VVTRDGALVCLYGCTFYGDVTTHLKTAHPQEWQRRSTVEDRVQIYRSGGPESWFWLRVSPDGTFICTGTHGFDTAMEAEAEARRVNARPYIFENSSSVDDTLQTDTTAGLSPQSPQQEEAT